MDICNLKGRPFSEYQLSKKRMANSSAVILVHMGRIQMSAPGQSVMDKIQLKLESSFKGPKKSIVMD